VIQRTEFARPLSDERQPECLLRVKLRLSLKHPYVSFHQQGIRSCIGSRPSRANNRHRPFRGFVKSNRLFASVRIGSHAAEDGMKFPRRRFLHLAAGTAALPVVPRIAWAQAYPSRPVRIVVPFPAGQATDSIARLMGQSLSERLGQALVIENRTGAGGNIGTEAVVHAPPDGYTLLLAGLSNAMNPTLYKKLNFNFIREIAPVASIGGVPYVMVINPSVPTKTVPEFIAYAKANPGKINMGSSGSGSVSHVFGERFKGMTGINLVHVPYRGGYVPDLLSGQVQVVFGTISSCIQYIRGGMLRALAVTTATRSDVLPDIPILAEFVPGYEASQWYGVGAPKSTSADIVDKLNREVNAGLADTKLKARLADVGVEPTPMTPAEFGKLIADDTEKWGKVIQAANIKAE
jgi:tripartite-type tricarboxylate transporter receptor subunit TctC